MLHVFIKVGLDEGEMVAILPSKPQRPIAIAYDDINHVVYWSDVRQRTINGYPLFNNDSRNTRTIYLNHDRMCCVYIVS